MCVISRAFHVSQVNEYFTCAESLRQNERSVRDWRELGAFRPDYRCLLLFVYTQITKTINLSMNSSYEKKLMVISALDCTAVHPGFCAKAKALEWKKDDEIVSSCNTLAAAHPIGRITTMFGWTPTCPENPGEAVWILNLNGNHLYVKNVGSKQVNLLMLCPLGMRVRERWREIKRRNKMERPGERKQQTDWDWDWATVTRSKVLQHHPKTDSHTAVYRSD